MRLALAQGRTLRELLEVLDPEELPLWLALEETNHILPDPWVQTATIAATVCNASGRYRSTVKASDFLPTSSAPADDDEDPLAIFDRLVPLG